MELLGLACVKCFNVVGLFTLPAGGSSVGPRVGVGVGGARLGQQVGSGWDPVPPADPFPCPLSTLE